MPYTKHIIQSFKSLFYSGIKMQAYRVFGIFGSKFGFIIGLFGDNQIRIANFMMQGASIIL
ncbi:MAG TPA: hypothetical protein DEA22_10340 [Blastocatellia bacterium]|nr:hypothetical protein [Blastocatellia bacterium]